MKKYLLSLIALFMVALGIKAEVVPTFSALAEGDFYLNNANKVAAGQWYVSKAISLTRTGDLPSDDSDVDPYATTLTVAAGTGSSYLNDKINIGEDTYSAYKIGTSSKTGSINVTVPAGAIGMNFYALSWSTAKTEVTATCGEDNKTYTATGAGISGNSPYTYDAEKGGEPEAHLYTYNFDAPLAEDAVISLSAPARVVFFGLNAVEVKKPEVPDAVAFDVVDPDVSDSEIWNIYQNEDYKLHIDIVKNLPLDPTRTYTLEDMDLSYSYIYNKNEVVTNQFGTKEWKKYQFTSISVKVGANNELEAVVEAKNGEDVISGTFVFNNPDPITVTLDGETEYVADKNVYAVSAKNVGSQVKADYGVQFGIKGDAYESKTTLTIDDLVANGNTIRVATTETKIASANITLAVDAESQTFEGTVVGADGKTYAVNVTTNIPTKETKKETIDFGAVLEVTEDEGDIKLLAQDDNAKFAGYITVNPVTTDIPSGEYNLLSYTKYGANSDFGYMLDAVEGGKVTVTNNEGEISIVATFKQNNVEYTVTATLAEIPYAGPAITFDDVEEGAEIDLAETKSIHISVALPEGIDENSDLYVEGVLVGMDGTNDPIFSFSDFEEGVDVSVARLTPGNAYQINITKIAFGEVVGMDEDTYMPIYENEFVAKEGESFATLNFSLKAAPQEAPEAEITVEGNMIYVAFPVGTDCGDNYSVKPYIMSGENKIEIADYYIDNTTGGFFDPLNLIVVELSQELADGDYTLVLPADMFIVDGGDNNSTWEYPFTIGASAIQIDLAVNGWGTYCAPFETEIPEGLKAYVVKDIDSNGYSLILDEQQNVVPAHTPVVLEGEAKLKVEGVAQVGTPEVGLMVGVYQDTPVPAGVCVLQNHSGLIGFYRVMEDNTITVPAFHAYLVPESSEVKVFTFGNADGIQVLESMTAGKAEIFDLNGRKQSKLQKGVNIVNGVKVLVK